MELTQVRYFVTLCKTLNFTRAAELCNVTQPAFTRAIQRLEDELGGPLLYRERNLTQLTALGREMQPHLTAMVLAAEAAADLAQARRRHVPSSLKIGLGPGIGAASVADAVGQVAKILPDVAIHFDESSPAALVDAMLTDTLDCALLPENCEMPERLNRWPLFHEIAVLVMPAAHRLAAQNAVAAADIVSETILAGDRCGGFAARLEGETGRQYNVRRCNGAVSQMLDMVAAGLGLALLSDRQQIATSAVMARKFVEPELSRRVVLAAVAGRPLNPAAANFVKLCRAKAFS
jgi:DNA-binding transcriptional LysR family regulator